VKGNLTLLRWLLTLVHILPLHLSRHKEIDVTEEIPHLTTTNFFIFFSVNIECNNIS
jgi:hypothetical protein